MQYGILHDSILGNTILLQWLCLEGALDSGQLPPLPCASSCPMASQSIRQLNWVAQAEGWWSGNPGLEKEEEDDTMAHPSLPLPPPLLCPSFSSQGCRRGTGWCNHRQGGQQEALCSPVTLLPSPFQGLASTGLGKRPSSRLGRRGSLLPLTPLLPEKSTATAKYLPVTANLRPPLLRQTPRSQGTQAWKTGKSGQSVPRRRWHLNTRRSQSL